MVEINIRKKHFQWLVVIMVFFAGIGIALAAWDSAKTMYHNAEDIKVTVNSQDYSLQEAITAGLIGGSATCIDQSEQYCPDDYIAIWCNSTTSSYTVQAIASGVGLKSRWRCSGTSGITLRCCKPT